MLKKLSFLAAAFMLLAISVPQAEARDWDRWQRYNNGYNWNRVNNWNNYRSGWNWNNNYRNNYNWNWRHNRGHHYGWRNWW